MNDRSNNIHEKYIEGLKRNDHHSQLMVYKLYYKSMFNTSFRILNNLQDAEDAMQEAFLNAFQRIYQYNHESTFGAWLKKIVINKSLDHLKKRDNIGTYEIENIAEDQLYKVGSESLIDWDIDEVIITKYLKESLDLIPERQKIVFSLSVIEGYEHSEIAEMLNISINNVSSLLSRGKEKLKKLILKRLDFEYFKIA